MSTISSPAPASPALDNLQAAILRLAAKPPLRPGGSGRQELNLLVGQALQAYREYMRTVQNSQVH